MRKILYVFPRTENFREERPRVCWEHMYGWMEGYGALFDPVVQSVLDAVPEWANGPEEDGADDAFLITACAEASTEVGSMARPGLYIRPDSGLEIEQRARESEKETLATPLGEFSYPFGLPFDRYREAAGDWRMGGRSATARRGSALAVGFELFAMFGWFRGETPEECFLSCAEVTARLLEAAGFPRGAAPANEGPRELRLDFQAYGLNRLFVQWLLEMHRAPRVAVAAADGHYLAALAAWRDGRVEAARGALGETFAALARIRTSISPLELRFLEYPHLGILFEDKGFFELEWPEYSRAILTSLFSQIDHYGYRVGIEAGASCWKNLLGRYPELAGRIRTLCESGRLELTNGTFSLPYALMSPLALQYWQFAKGNDLFRELFGRSPTTYQCQENSLTPQMPELLRHFGYDRALHITQNRGEAPADTREFIRWSSPAGHGVPALTAPDPRLTRKGNNYFLDLPLIHKEYGRRTAPMHYVNFQDLGYVPFRIQMMRAHHYAPVWGRFCSSAEVFPDVRPEALPAAAYDADAYKFSANLFYSDETNVNALSHYRRVHALNGRRRQLLLAAQAAGKLPALCETINSVIENILLLEAHDCCVVQGQRRGEFHSRNTLLNPPYSRETLVQKVDELAAAVDAVHEGAIGGIAGAAPALLFNAAEVPLSFGRVRYPERFAGGGSVPFVGAVYAAGPFPAFDAVAPAAAGPLTRHELPCVHGTWTLQAADGRVGLEIGGRQARFAPVDRRHGAFELRGAELKRAGSLLFAEFWWTLSAPRLQAVVTSVVLSEAGDYAEVGARYAPRLDFDVRSKWTDYLALEWSLGATLDEVVRFNPNVSAPTREDRVVSPCVLEVAAAACGGLAFLNEGEAAYEVDRGGGRVRWLFHVACETVHERRMAVAFGGGDAFRLSRAWGQGLLPVAGVADRFLAAQDWRGISVEDCLDADTLLVSNLLDREHTVDLGAGAAGRPLVSENTQAASTLRLRPFEIGLIRRQRKEHG